MKGAISRKDSQANTVEQRMIKSRSLCPYPKPSLSVYIVPLTVHVE